MSTLSWFKVIPVLLGILCAPLEADDDSADYVIVGLGTAGGLLAGKLTQDKKTSVIALHSGKNLTDSFLVKFSQNMTYTVGLSFLGLPPDFNPDSFPLPPALKERFARFSQQVKDSTETFYETGNSVPQVNADDRVISWVIAQPGAGASSVNAGAWVRITPQVLSQWEAIAGHQWSPSNLLKVYKELEKYDGKSSNQHARGHHGPIHVTQDPHASILSKKFTRAMILATGVPFATDYNNPKTPLSVSKQIQSAHRGTDGFYRVSSINAFLNSHVMTEDGDGKEGRRLKVHFNSTALRVIWKGKTAVGVEYLHHGKKKSVYAKKGVIVCAGLRSSPFLLHSGVGPASLLRSLDIPVVYNNPNVGQGLIDQTPVPIVFATNPYDSQAGTTTFFTQIGNLPAPGGVPSGRQIRFVPIDAIPGITPVVVDLLQPQSRGSITINSNNPLDQPVVNFGVLSNANDLDLLTATFQTYVKNLNLQLQLIDPEYELLLPPPDILDDVSLVHAYIRAIVGTDFHYQGHCRMAPLKQGGVVDSHGRVHGVHNLIIADNSIVPSPIDGSPMTSAYLIAANIARLMGY